MTYFYTPFQGMLNIAIRHGGGQCASINSGICLGQRKELSVVAHCYATSYKIFDNLGNSLTAEQLIVQMVKQGLGRGTNHIFLHACNGGGGKFEESLKIALRNRPTLLHITVSGYAGFVARGVDGKPVVLPDGFQPGKGNRNASVVPRGKK
jgi:hypothetical protein